MMKKKSEPGKKASGSEKKEISVLNNSAYYPGDVSIFQLLTMGFASSYSAGETD